MRIAFVLTNLAGGGAEKAVLKLAQALGAAGHAVEVIVFETHAEHDVPAAVKVVSLLPAPRRASRGLLGRWLLARRLRDCVGQRHDLVISTLPFADAVALGARLPHHWCRIANTLSAEIARLPAAKAARRKRRYQRLYAGRPLVAVSEGVARDLRESFGFVRQPIRAIPNPFDFESIRRDALLPVQGLPAGPYMVHVGRFSPQKRHDLLLAAYATLTDAPPLVLLTAPDPALLTMIERAGLQGRVSVAGFQANPYPWIARASLLVLCSDHEGLPNVIIEALILGTPVVSTDCPSGPREILGAAAAHRLVPCGDVQALAQTIGRTLQEPRDTGRPPLDMYASSAVAAAYGSLASTVLPLPASPEGR